MTNWEKCLAAGAIVFACCWNAAAQSPVRPLQFAQTRFELHKGEPVSLSGSSDTLSFLLNARSRTVTMNGAPVKGLIVGPDRSGGVVLAASLRTKAGEYQATVTAVSASGETRQTTLDVTVDPLTPVTTGASRDPVVLLNGWEVGFTNNCPIAASSSVTFGNLASYLVSDGVPVVYLFDNCLEDPGNTIEQLGNDLGDFLNSIQYTNGEQAPQIDLVAFSMGALIARSYLAGLQPSTEALYPPVPTLVHKMVMVAPMNFGSFLAEEYSASIPTDTQSAELIPGSALLWNLATWNQFGDDLRGVPTISVVGYAGTYTPSLTSGIAQANSSDGVVDTISASTGFVYGQTASVRLVPYCHVDPSAFTNTSVFGAFQCNAPGIANVTSTSQPTGEIVRSFLGGTTAWESVGYAPSQDQYLSAYGGLYFGLAASSGAYAADLSAVEWGTVALSGGEDTSVIFFQDFVRGTGTMEASSASLGSVNCGSVTAPVGAFSAVRCKEGAAITSVTPLLTSSPRVVTAGGNIVINGGGLSGSCSGCKVVATPAGSSTGTQLTVSSWTNTAITAALPASLAGPLILTVNATTGTDSVSIIAGTATPSTISLSSASLQFSAVAGASTPAAQTVQITNSGAGTLAWTATASTSSGGSWLGISPSSGTAPSALTVTIASSVFSGLAAGTYSGSISIASSGASNTPQSIGVTLTVSAAAPVLAVSPLALAFSYTVGGTAPAAQTVSITNAGGGSLAWTAASNNYWVVVSPTSMSGPGTLSISINPANLAAGTYTSSVPITAAGASGSPASIAITLVVQGSQPAPSITAVANAGSYQPGGASATWLAIFGTNLSSETYTWQSSDFVNGALPTSLQGVTVTIDGIPGYISYLSPTQINVLAPDDSTTGAVQVQVTTAGQASKSVTMQKAQYAPSFFTLDGTHIAALHLNYTLVGSPGLLPGVTSTPAQPGETIVLYGTGFGPANPPLPTGQLITTPSVLPTTPTMTMGGMQASVTYAGLVSPGLYQFNVVAPSNLPAGDAAVVATIGGVSTQTGAAVTVQ